MKENIIIDNDGSHLHVHIDDQYYCIGKKSVGGKKDSGFRAYSPAMLTQIKEEEYNRGVSNTLMKLDKYKHMLEKTKEFIHSLHKSKVQIYPTRGFIDLDTSTEESAIDTVIEGLKGKK